MKATVEQLLLGCVVLAFGLGYLAGGLKAGQNPLVIQPSAPAQVAPSNYDPARAICSDALKNAEEARDRCFTQFLAYREQEMRKAQVGH